ncbi:MAG: TetR/AcrR family transcriptional regulator [Actinomycetota bacterium]|nr:TetR/AcrR family transcriptional regulator [Actinomycetota bacterium]
MVGRGPDPVSTTAALVPAPAGRRELSGRGRPRSDVTEHAILQAATELLAERGLAAMTIEDVAARAHVGKASIYRRWPSKGTLAFDAFVTDFLDRQPVPATGNLRDDLLGLLRSWVRAVRQPTTGRTLKGLIAEVQRDPELAEAWRDRFVGPLRRRHLGVLQRAIERGELPPDTNTLLLLDLLYGPAYHRLLHGHLPLNDAFVEDLVAAIMAAIEAHAI